MFRSRAVIIEQIYMQVAITTSARSPEPASSQEQLASFRRVLVQAAGTENRPRTSSMCGTALRTLLRKSAPFIAVLLCTLASFVMAQEVEQRDHVLTSRPFEQPWSVPSDSLRAACERLPNEQDWLSGALPSDNELTLGSELQ